MIGGYLNLLDAGHRVGHGDTIIMESCEYCNSFLNFTPTIAVILDIDADHLDFFKDLEDIKHSFRQFAELTPEDRGIVIANGMDKNTMDALKGIDRRVITFGLTPDMDVYPLHFRPGPLQLRRDVQGQLLRPRRSSGSGQAQLHGRACRHCCGLGSGH